jgi:hypothetical protein
MIRVTTIAVAAVAITALLTVAAGLLASSAVRVLFARHEQWWWPLVMDGVTIIGWTTPFLSVGIALGIALRKPRVRGGNTHLTPKLPVLGL